MIYTYQFLDYSDLPLAHLLAHRPGLVEAMVQSGSNSLDLDLRYGCWWPQENVVWGSLKMLVAYLT